MVDELAVPRLDSFSLCFARSRVGPSGMDLLKLMGLPCRCARCAMFGFPTGVVKRGPSRRSCFFGTPFVSNLVVEVHKPWATRTSLPHRFSSGDLPWTELAPLVAGPAHIASFCSTEVSLVRGASGLRSLAMAVACRRIQMLAAVAPLGARNMPSRCDLCGSLWCP